MRLATSTLKFAPDMVSDQKRLTRGEHLLLARRLLRARDRTHHAKWRVLMLAGGHPGGEVGALRELMPKAHITAVDRDHACLDAAIDAGVDDVVACDLADIYQERTSAYGARPMSPCAALCDVPDFDLIDLDLCANVTPVSRDMVRVYGRKLSRGGVFMVTFSYGRDVIEFFEERDYPAIWRSIVQSGAPERLLKRIAYLVGYNSSYDKTPRVRSVMAYRGNEMPMCAVLLGNGRSNSGGEAECPSFVKVDDGDLEAACVYPDVASLYDCPRERIEAFRRSAIARRAAATRSDARGDQLFAAK